MAVRLGINPITWTNDDMPELGGDTPLDVCLAEARLAGYAESSWAASFRGRPRCCGRSSIGTASR
jgi:inosose dehydratase